MSAQLQLKHHLLGWLLVLAQFICLAILAGYPPALPHSKGWLIVWAGGFLLIAWAALTMHRGSLTVHPLPRATGSLAVRGPYKWVRHPMYTGVLLIALAQLSIDYSPGRWMSVLALGGIFLGKITLEEKYLKNTYPAYAAYQKQTRRLIPFIY